MSAENIVTWTTRLSAVDWVHSSFDCSSKWTPLTPSSMSFVQWLTFVRGLKSMLIYRMHVFSSIGLKEPRMARHVVAIKTSTWTTAVERDAHHRRRGRTCSNTCGRGTCWRVSSCVQFSLGATGRRGPSTSRRSPWIRKWLAQSLQRVKLGRLGRVLKLGNILHQADDSEILPLPSNDIAVLVSTWIRLF